MSAPTLDIASKQEQTAKDVAADKAAAVCLDIWNGASTLLVHALIVSCLMQFYHQGALDVLNRQIASKE